MTSLALTLFLLLLTTITIYAALNRASFGETCDKATRCDSRASLACNNGTCRCIKETEMIYDLKSAKCVVLSGERCSYAAIETLADETQEKRYAEKLDCVENAVCQEDGYCGCASNFFENSEGSCLPKLSYGESCLKSEECESTKNLLCQNGKCSCNGTTSVYDPTIGQCVGKVGSPCIWAKCIKNAICGNAYYSARTCVCPDDHFETLEGPCAPKFGVDETCSKNEECLASLNLVCANSRCWCNETEALYDFKRDQCVQKVGIEVIPVDKYRQFCVQHAYRQDYPQRCICSDEYVETSDGTCKPKLSYGQACTHDNECNPKRNLICTNGQCSCRGHEWMYDARTQNCLVKVGQLCSNDDRGNRLPCVTNAACFERHCRCQRNGYSTFQAKNGICHGKYGSLNCHPTYSPCLYDLACVNNECTCPFPKYQTFDDESRKCVSKLHGPCSEKVDGKLLSFSCNSDWMECRKDNGVLECLCKKGYIESKSGHCKNIHGSPCDYSSECDEIAGLKCWNGTCKCRDLEEYREIKNLCVGLVGANCGDEGERTIGCTTGAFCKSARDQRISSRCQCLPEYHVSSDRKCRLFKMEGGADIQSMELLNIN